MAKTPQLLVTDKGLAAASDATPYGPFVRVTQFRIGDAYGYAPQRTDEDINGHLLFSDKPTTYNYVGDNTINIILRIPPDAGPFAFGEVGIYIDDPNDPNYNWTADPLNPNEEPPNIAKILFAKAVFDEPQQKYSSLGTNVGSSYTFNCLLKLEQSVAIFQISDATYYPAILDVACWSDVIPPNQQANPEVKSLRVAEWNGSGDVSFLNAVDQPDAAQFWAVNSTSYYRYRSVKGDRTASHGEFPVANASQSWIDIDASRLHVNDITQANRQFLIRTSEGHFRSVQSVVQMGNNYRFNLNVTNDGRYQNRLLPSIPPIGSLVTVWRDDQAGGTVFYDNIVDPPPPPPLANWDVPGLATVGSGGLTLEAPGRLATHGLLHDVPNSGRGFANGEDISQLFPTGIYMINGNQPGVPVGQVAAHLLHIWYGGGVTQVFYPLDRPDIPTYWRWWANNRWGPWRYYWTDANNNLPPMPPVIMTGVNIDQLGQNWSDPGQAVGIGQRCMWVLNLNDGGGGGDCIVRCDFTRTSPPGRQIVGRASRYGGAGYGRWATVTGMANAGDTLYFQMKDWNTRTLYRYYF
ncbi:tail fiber protein [Burkholderia phage BCSR5]|nr:tail fiber protein [Burkholderia phage BCSR5]